MGAVGDGFRVAARHPSECQTIKLGEVTTWKWDLTPIGREAIGVNELEVVIYLPKTAGSDSISTEVLKSFEFEIKVLRSPGIG